MAEFFDLFNHRLLSLFYRAWEKHHFPVRYQLAAARTQTDDLTAYLFDVIGLGTAGLRGRMTVPDHALLRYAGLFAQRPRCVASLRAILHDYFGVPVEIQEFIGAWHRLKPENKADLESAGLNNCLGLGAIAGDMIWDPQGRFRVQLGPLKLDEFAAFLPGQEATTKLHDLVRFFVGPVLDFEVQLILQADEEVDEVPWPILGGDSEVAPRLGWSAWLKTEPFVQHALDALF
jgi:type VI secretion system protein ImpH